MSFTSIILKGEKVIIIGCLMILNSYRIVRYPMILLSSAYSETKVRSFVPVINKSSNQTVQRRHRTVNNEKRGHTKLL